MFDYLKNSYNLDPFLIQEDKLRDDHLYVRYIQAPYLDLPKNKEEYKTLHKRKFWYNLRRSQKLYEKKYGKLNFEVITDKDRLEYFLDNVFIMFNEKWSEEYTSAAWKHRAGFDKYKKAMIELASIEKSFLAVLYDEKNNLLSYGYCLIKSKTVFFYQHTTSTKSEYRSFSLGKLLIHNLLQHCIDNKFIKFDFMAGNSPYKYEWAKKSNDVYRIIGKKSLSNYLKKLFFTVRYFLQFNKYSRRILKFIMTKYEKINGKI